MLSSSSLSECVNPHFFHSLSNAGGYKKVIFVSKTGKKYPYKTKVTISEFVLFNGESKPEVADMVSIDKHIEKLYKRRN